MNQRIIEITDMQAHLSLHRGFLKVSIKDSKNYEIPLYDIGGIISNSYSITYSSSLLVKLAELNIPFIICGVNHSPAAFLFGVAISLLVAVLSPICPEVFSPQPKGSPSSVIA